MKKLPALIVIFFLFACSGDKDRVGSLLEFIPENTFAIIKSNAVETLGSDIKNNDFLSKFSTTSTYKFVSDEIHFLEWLKPKSEVLFAFSTEADSSGSYTLITRQHPQLFSLDSLRDKKVETLQFSDFSIQKITLNEKEVYTAAADSVFLLASSQKNLEKILVNHKKNDKKITDKTLEKIYATGSAEGTTVFINGKNFSKNISRIFPEAGQALENFASWIAVDTDIYPDEIKLSGIALAQSQDDTLLLLEVFKGTFPQKNETAFVTPVSADGFISYTYNDFEVLQNNLKAYQKDNDSLPGNEALFKSLNEIGVIYKGSEKIIALHAVDGSITAENLVPLQETQEDFRNVSIKIITDSTVFNRAFYPLVKNTKPQYFAQLDELFVFTEQKSSLEEIISEYVNKATLGFRPFYEDHFQSMSDQSSILLVSLNENLKNRLQTGNQEHIGKTADSDFSKLPMTALQFVYDGHFAHVNGIIREAGAGKRSTGVSQVFNIALDNAVLKYPQLVDNHLTKGKDIVVQDVANKLYLISASGRVLWNKQLDGPVLGNIRQVDLYKNGRLQLAFTTQKAFYILDRNGKEVAPFPLKFNDDITQPLAVFDYDNNRNYRFVITQGSELLMYDSKAKTVGGFLFKKATSKVVLPPQHLRMSNKDYILIAEENGKLNILSRTGTHRINVSKKFSFSSAPIVAENEKFVFLSANDTKEIIDQNGKVTSESMTSSSAHLLVSGRTKVTLEDNILRINNKRIELPFGLYTEPVISVSNQRILISVTDLQQQRVYVYNSLGELLPNFPVYGTSVMQLGDANNNGRPNGVTKGGDKNVVLYEVN